jgi:hypothetical protein
MLIHIIKLGKEFFLKLNHENVKNYYRNMCYRWRPCFSRVVDDFQLVQR